MAISEDTQALVAAQLAAAWAKTETGAFHGSQEELVLAYKSFRKRILAAEKELLDERTGGAKSQVYFS
ncbi:hypothetical protein FHW96_002838 [Novosphingobium sp. SG751A]|uniref:hypothetical protein n=1 Tax=Novosphingobium sp. SG751A TaxID=2587000 RepID=UPI001551E843|nr:hypothetical protein [Novosphingobium sp. SG751A]NOW46678.1 hypothetical protein [Novosphingobium sp. SG751A]